MSGTYQVGLYARLSRDDGDKPDSDSITNQLNMLQQYCADNVGLEIVKTYVDDGYTGTNFDRPDFKHMIADVEKGIINCIIVKDLSRFGRDYIDTGAYLERIFPARGVRFIAVNDHIDSNRGPYDMMLPLKNIFNAQYAKDISGKIRSSFDTKRKQGQFIGAFCSYGYRKDPDDHNRLEIDEPAAQVVRHIFSLFEEGKGKHSIARILNAKGIPCPSEYKRLMGARYRNGKKMDATTYWTYSTVARILANQIYAGDMVQAKYTRQLMHGKAKKQDKDKWIVAANTHAPIITRAQWDRVQAQLLNTSRIVDFSTKNNALFGYLKCGDCGRGMVLRTKGKQPYYNCGTYDRYGPSICSKHKINKADIERIILDDLNRVISVVADKKTLVKSVKTKTESVAQEREKARIILALERVARLRKGVYEDYKEGLINKADYLAYREDYEQKERQLKAQCSGLERAEDEKSLLEAPWVKQLLEKGYLDILDRATIAETIKSISVHEDGRIEITYRFSKELATLFLQPERIEEEREAT